MKIKIAFLVIILVTCAVLTSWAGEDTYIGDTAIYGGSTSSVSPNVLIIFDSSGSMSSTITMEVCTDDSDDDGEADVVSGAYDSSIDYTSLTTNENCSIKSSSRGKTTYSSTLCEDDIVYECADRDWAQRGYCSTWITVGNLTVSSINCSSTIQSTLESTGYYTGTTSLKRNGSCQLSSGSNYYATGNWIDYDAIVSSGESTDSLSTTNASGEVCTTVTDSKLNVAHDVVADLIESTEGVNFGVMRFNGSSGGKFITQTVDGSSYTTTIKDMDDVHSGTVTNREALIEIVNDIPAQDYTPLGETMYEALQYFEGDSGYFQKESYTSPITSSCQANYVIIITDGMATQDSSVPLSSLCSGGDCDGDGNAADDAKDDALDDVAYYMYNTDLSDDYTGTQNVITYTIGFGLGGSNTDAVQLLQDTADNGQGTAEGEGSYYEASDYSTLSTALSSIISQVLDQNSAFVAPVVPSSPENRVYSGNRIYFGFFKPVTDGDWLGNLKKFGLNSSGEVIDANGNAATDSDGVFLDSAVSYWGTGYDGGDVDEGGVGQLLIERDLSSDPRNIYTYLGTSTSLTHSSNAFSTASSVLTYSYFDVDSDDEKNKIINYIHGYDTYDDDVDSDTSEQREWIFGDILHSRPAIQVYQNYTSNYESDSNYNKTVIYVGANDGQLHAFSDADGSELWSFIPPEMLPYLQGLPDNDVHEFFIDSTPVRLVYDYDKDGNIGTGPEAVDDDSDDGSDDRVILIFGLRRGGGSNVLSETGSRGAYYALDVTDPEKPEYLWSIDSTTTDSSGDVMCPELGETWSVPVLGKVRFGGITRIVAFIGAGYDNNEDLRFGDTLSFPDDTTETSETILSTGDAGEVTSDGSSEQVNPRGRGIYVLELAQYSTTTGLPVFHSMPVKFWEYVYDEDRSSGDNPTYSFPTGLTALDTDSDGYIDRLYAGDTGGQMWRFDISNKTVLSGWTGRIVFAANPSNSANSESGGTVTNGRKIFYPPAAVYESGYTGLYFGSGDRAHPLNQGVVDRLYAFYDRNSSTAQSEASMVNVTEDVLQSDDADFSMQASCSLTSSSAYCILQNLYSSDYYGWFIKLDEDSGEKVLAYPTVYNRVVYYTTFVPNMDTDDPCLTGNLGASRVYALDYKTGEAVYNYDSSNDGSTSNSRASGDDGAVLSRSDRYMSVGSGIATNLVVGISGNSSYSAVGTGTGVVNIDLSVGGNTVPLYWLMD